MNYFLTAFLTITLLCAATHAKATEDGIAVLELFTSPFCDDTPPADDAFKSIVADDHPNVIALRCPVTYFGEDSFSGEFCDKRHAAYFIGLRLRGISTPQIIINGEFDTVGTVESTVRAGVRMGQSLKTITPLTLDLRNNILEMTLPDMPLADTVEVLIFGYDKLRAMKTSAKDGGDLTLNYTNTVRHIKKLMDWDGSHESISYPLQDMPADGYAVLVQRPKTMEILAAGKVEKQMSFNPAR